MGLKSPPETVRFDPPSARADEPPYISVLAHGAHLKTLGQLRNKDRLLSCPYMGSNEDGQSYPCRKCVRCLDARRTLMSGLAMAEAYGSAFVVFVTLTYRDEDLDEAALSKDRVRAWVQSLRRRGYRFAYFGIAEYGGKTGRPHFHFILFLYPEGRAFDIALEVTQEDARVTCWPYGGAKFETPRKGPAECVGYLMDYVAKPFVREFKSRGFGKEYLHRYVAGLAEQGAPLVRSSAVGADRSILFRVPISREFRKRREQVGATSSRVRSTERQRKSLGGVRFRPLWAYRLPVSHHWAEALAQTYIAAYQRKWGCEPPLDYVLGIKGDY